MYKSYKSIKKLQEFINLVKNYENLNIQYIIKENNPLKKA